MSRKFVLEGDYYGEAINLYKRKKVIINPGVTVLVGCNGIGKTTLLHQIRDELRENHIQCIEYDNLHDGGSDSISEAGFMGDFAFMTTAMQSSEGENIVMNINKFASELGNFVKNGILREKIHLQRYLQHRIIQKWEKEKSFLKDGYC